MEPPTRDGAWRWMMRARGRRLLFWWIPCLAINVLNEAIKRFLQVRPAMLWRWRAASAPGARRPGTPA